MKSLLLRSQAQETPLLPNFLHWFKTPCMVGERPGRTDPMPLACHSSQLHLRINFGFLWFEEACHNYKPTEGQK